MRRAASIASLSSRILHWVWKRTKWLMGLLHARICKEPSCQTSSRFSSKAAQKSDWQRGHKYECKALRSPQSRPNALHRLVARVLWKRGAEMKAQAAAKATAGAPTAAAGSANPGESMQSGGRERTAPSYWHSCGAVATMQGRTGLFSGLSRACIANLLSSHRHCRLSAQHSLQCFGPLSVTLCCRAMLE